MRKFPATILSLLAIAPVLAARPAKAAPSALPTPAQSECAVGNPGRGEAKFTGQISGGPTGSLIEVTEGSESILVVYNNSTPVCAGGQPASPTALKLGATVVAYGPEKKKGKSLQMTATRILVAGSSQSGMRSGPSMSTNDEAVARGGSQPINNSGGAMTQGMSDPVSSNQRPVASQKSGSVAMQDDWQNPGQAPSNSQSSGASQGSGSDASQDTSGSVRGRSNSPAISCSALIFSVSSRDSATGHAPGRETISGITCRMPIDQLALQLTEDALTARRLPDVELGYQNYLQVLLTNAEVSSVQFASDNGTEVAEVTFTAQKLEITHLPSKTRVSF